MRISDLEFHPVIINVLGILYFCIILYTLYRILMDTESTPKTLAYFILVMFVPLIGIIFFFSFGDNHRHRKITRLNEKELNRLSLVLEKNREDDTMMLLKKHAGELQQFKQLVLLLQNLGEENLSSNEHKLLNNGEEKFKDVLKELNKASSFIHIEYYAWENDIRGNDIKDMLIKKAKEGLMIRVIYDAYASRGIKNNIVKELKEAGVRIKPIIEIKLERFANRLNHRDHRKIIIIDGKVGYVGGINISDRYDNSIDTGLYWRDTHVKIIGEAVLNLQRHFLANWNTMLPDESKVRYTKGLYPDFDDQNKENRELTQIVAGGPMNPFQNIMLAYSKLFSLANHKLYIANPYFIPNAGILSTLKQAALSGVDVRILIPKESDSKLVGAASKFYFKELLLAGVKIYLYEKGFLHAKTVVVDTYASVVGTANMDLRSFDLNFEIMSVIYGKKFGKKMEVQFLNDLENSEEVSEEKWKNLSKISTLKYSVARLISSFL